MNIDVLMWSLFGVGAGLSVFGAIIDEDSIACVGAAVVTVGLCVVIAVAFGGVL